MTTLHVWGAAGYAASEVVRYALAHPFVELGVLESRSHADERIGDHFPLLRSEDRRFAQAGTLVAEARAGDVVILAGGHGEAVAIAPQLLDRGARVIDLSSDYRFDVRATYGLAEWNREAIAAARLVANPGCYPTAAALALLPLASVVVPSCIAIDAKSGITGAGRNPSVGSLYAEVAGDVRAYGLEGHRHQPEIERNLERAGIVAHVTFTPHVVPMSRGMLVGAYVMLDEETDASAVHAEYVKAYAASPFVRLVDGTRAPSVAAVNGTNGAEIRVDARGRVVRALCAIDNLGKGAAGQAIQNLNIMLGYPEETGFHARAVVA